VTYAGVGIAVRSAEPLPEPISVRLPGCISIRNSVRAPARIAQVANFYSPQSGGLRTTVDMLGQGYVAAGFERVLVVPGVRDRDEQTPAGRRVTLRAPAVPGGGGYRLFPDWRRVAAVLTELHIDRIEVSDKLTLWPLGPWATARGIPAVLLSHERLDAIVAPRLPRCATGRGGPVARVADRCNRRLAAAFPTIVAASAFSCEEWYRIGAEGVVRVPLGVDLTTFRPQPGARHAVAELVCVGRLSREKRPDLAVRALYELVGAGIAARLTMVGGGPETARLARWADARGLPVRFTGHVGDRRDVAAILAGADAVLAPCPVEAFGLAVVEALASGTPVVICDRGAAPELLTAGCGLAAPPRPSALASAVATVLSWPPGRARVAARRRAEHYPWSTTVAAMLAAHQLSAPVVVAQCG
jgi:alpha-1,6-mannosyltransferase